MGTLFAALLAEAGLVTYRVIGQGWTKDYPLPMPLPADYVAIGLIYAALALLNEAQSIRPLPALVGWGVVIATALNLWSPTGKVAPGSPPSSIESATPAPTAGPAVP